MHLRRLVPVSLSLAFALATTPGLASLGGNDDSIHSDAAALGGAESTETRSTYTIHEIQTDKGVFREFLSVKGNVVFAVTWKDKKQPKLQGLLGSHFEKYREAAKAAKGKKVSIEEADFVVHASGNTGAAYLPKHLPAGFSLEHLKP